MPMLTGPDAKPAEVNSEGQLATRSIIEELAFHANHDWESLYTVLVDVTTASTDDDFFYIKNTDVRDIVIYKISGWCDDANQEIKVLIGGTDAGTNDGDALTPVNLNAGAISKAADVDCTQDATDLAITGGSVCRLLKFPTTALELAEFDFVSGIIIPKNQRLHLEAAIAGLINLNITFFFNEVE